MLSQQFPLVLSLSKNSEVKYKEKPLAQLKETFA